MQYFVISSTTPSNENTTMELASSVQPDHHRRTPGVTIERASQILQMAAHLIDRLDDGEVFEWKEFPSGDVVLFARRRNRSYEED